MNQVIRVIARTEPRADAAYEKLRMAILATTEGYRRLGEYEQRASHLRTSDFLNGGEAVWAACQRQRAKVADLEKVEAAIRLTFERSVKGA